MDQQERETFSDLLRLLSRIDPWVERVTGNTPAYADVGSGSALRGDDARVHPYEMSHAVWGALSHAIDHVHAVRSMVREAAVIHNYAPYTLLRAAIENAAVAVWLLAPASRVDRVTRRLRLASADINGGEEVKELIGKAGPRSRQQRVAEVRSIATAAGVNADRAAAPAGYRGIVESAGGQIDVGEKMTRLLWHMGSGIAHGDLWATVSATQADEVPGAPPGMKHLRVTAGLNGIYMMTAAAILLIDKGWGLYELRGRPIL